MSALREYIAEARRQRDLLVEADDRDSFARDIASGCLDPQPVGCRRVFTRQDANRFEVWVSACDEVARAEAGGPLPSVSADCGRASSRVQRIVRRLSLREWHQRALTEANEHGVFSVMAPVLESATTVHERLLAAWREFAESGQFADDLNEVEREHSDAIDRLELYEIPARSNDELSPTATRTVTDSGVSRDAWIYQTAMSNVQYTKIIPKLKAMIADHPDWELIESVNGIKAAVARHAKQTGNPMPAKRQGGRPKNMS